MFLSVHLDTEEAPAIHDALTQVLPVMKRHVNRLPLHSPQHQEAQQDLAMLVLLQQRIHTALYE